MSNVEPVRDITQFHTHDCSVSFTWFVVASFQTRINFPSAASQYRQAYCIQPLILYLKVLTATFIKILTLYCTIKDNITQMSEGA